MLRHVATRVSERLRQRGGSRERPQMLPTAQAFPGSGEAVEKVSRSRELLEPFPAAGAFPRGGGSFQQWGGSETLPC